jgi:hypothetical protein
MNNALYIKGKDGTEIMLHFFAKNADSFLAAIDGLVKINKDSYGCYLASQQPIYWIDKTMSNYEYLQWLN